MEELELPSDQIIDDDEISKICLNESEENIILNNTAPNMQEYFKIVIGQNNGISHQKENKKCPLKKKRGRKMGESSIITSRKNDIFNTLISEKRKAFFVSYVENLKEIMNMREGYIYIKFEGIENFYILLIAFSKCLSKFYFGIPINDKKKNKIMYKTFEHSIIEKPEIGKSIVNWLYSSKEENINLEQFFKVHNINNLKEEEILSYLFCFDSKQELWKPLEKFLYIKIDKSILEDPSIYKNINDNINLNNKSLKTTNNLSEFKKNSDNNNNNLKNKQQFIPHSPPLLNNIDNNDIDNNNNIINTEEQTTLHIHSDNINLLKTMKLINDIMTNEEINSLYQILSEKFHSQDKKIIKFSLDDNNIMLDSNKNINKRRRVNTNYLSDTSSQSSKSPKSDYSEQDFLNI